MKKQDKEVLTIFVIIILVIVFMAIFLGVLAKPDEQHFKITKEECWNETKGMEINLNCENVTFNYLIEDNLNEVLLAVCEVNFLSDIDEKICEQVEVDEIEICEFELSIEKCFEKEDYYFFEKNINESYCCSKIFKKDLKIEWLDKNCECIEKYNKEKNTLCLVEESGCETFEYDSCSEYKCGEYFVETWNQIK